jgi:hypothetical protein
MIRRARLLRPEAQALVLVFGLALLVCLAGRQLGAQQTPDPLEVIPRTWVDLPEAPFGARVVLGRAVLVNRSNTTFESVSTGCVREDGGRARIVGSLFGSLTTDGAFTPSGEVEGLLRILNNIEHYMSLSDFSKQCPAESRMAVTAASARSGYRWSAEGTPWPK